MLWLKVISPLVVLAAGVIQILLELKWHDKRTKAHRRTRLVLISTMVVATVLAVALSVKEHIESEHQATLLREVRDQSQEEAARAETRELEAQTERNQLQAQVASLEQKLEPFLVQARERYPSLADDAALAALGREVVDLKRRSEALTAELEALRRYSSIARLDLFGTRGLAGAGLTESSPISRALEGAFVERDNKAFPRCDSVGIQTFRNVASQFPDFPFSYYALAVCLRGAGDPAWRQHAESAIAIFSHTVSIAGHHQNHDEAYKELRGYLDEDK